MRCASYSSPSFEGRNQEVRCRALSEQPKQPAFGIARRGWWPAKGAHHPPEIKAAIRRAGFVPRLKQCFQNCQRLVLFGDLADAVYHEGVVRGGSGHPLEHAWITWQ